MSIQEKKLVINKEFNPIIAGIVLQRNWKSPILLVIFFCSLAFIYLRYTKPVYQSNAVLQIVEEDKVSQVLGEVTTAVQETNINQEVEFLRSDFLLDQTIKKLNISTNLYSEGKLLTKDLYHSTRFKLVPIALKDSSLCNKRVDIEYSDGKIQLKYEKAGIQKIVSGYPNKAIKNADFELIVETPNLSELQEAATENKLYFVFNRRSDLLNQLKKNLIVMAMDMNAKTIQITYDDQNPILCRDIVVKLLESYFEYQEGAKKTNSNKTIDFINQQLDSLSNVVKKSKSNLSDYQKREKIPDPVGLEEELSTKMSDLSEKVLLIDEELTTLYMVADKIKIDPNRVELYKMIPEMIGKRSFEGSLLRQIEDLNKLLEQKEDLLKDLTIDNNQIKNVNSKVQIRISSIKKSMKVIEDRLLSDKQLLVNKINEIETNYYNLPEKAMEYDRLKYMEELNNRYFELFTEKKVQYELSNAGYSSTNRVLTPPVFPNSPLSPNKKLIYATAIIFGIFCGIGLLVWRYLTYNDIINAKDLEKLLPPKANFIGAVPLYKKKMKYSQVVVTESSKSRVAESIRSIRANMSFIKKDAKVIAVSSSISGEGKTFVILNLAGLIAASGKKTVVIDLDLRKPKVHFGFNAENIDGMSSVISGMTSIDSVIRNSQIGNLDFITAGPIPPNPSELIQSDEFKLILENLKDKYDVVMIDNPPVGIVSDGIEILANADIPLYVFKANYSKRVFVQRVEELFKVQKLQSLNIILNGVETGRSFYGYGYGYGYGYDSGYYSEEEEEIPLHLRWWRKIKQKWNSKKKQSKE